MTAVGSSALRRRLEFAVESVADAACQVGFQHEQLDDLFGRAGGFQLGLAGVADAPVPGALGEYFR